MASAAPGQLEPEIGRIGAELAGAFPSSARHPWVRVGRWTLLYRRSA